MDLSYNNNYENCLTTLENIKSKEKIEITTPEQNNYYSIMEVVESARIIPIAPSNIFSDVASDESLDLDNLPPLSLPPPLVPFKLYGHNYLEKKIYLQIQLSNLSNSPNQSSLNIFGMQNICSLRLIISTDPECGIPYNIMLPQRNENEIMTFFVDKNQDVNIEINLYKAFGMHIMGKAVIPASRIKQIMEYGIGDGSDPIEQCIVPLLDSHLHVIGEIALKLFLISPFSHPSLEIGGKVQTYWKSTATTKLVNKSNQEVGRLSFITASSLSDEYILLPIQLTKDGVPVVYPQWIISTNGIDLKISDITYKQFKLIGEKIQKENSDKDEERNNTNSFNNLLKILNYSSLEQSTYTELIKLIYNSYLSLEDVLVNTSQRIGLNIEVQYPTPSVREAFDIKPTFNINKTVDIILNVVYNFSDQRSITFTSFNPSVCTSLKWKQPNYAVFFGSCCGYKINYNRNQRTNNFMYCDNTDQEEIQTERLCSSLKEAIKFAKVNHLIGILCEVTPLVQRPSLINTIKESGLFLATFGKYNSDIDSVKLQEKLGVDAYINNEIFKIFK